MKLVFLTLVACLFALISKTARTENSGLRLASENNLIQNKLR